MDVVGELGEDEGSVCGVELEGRWEPPWLVLDSGHRVLIVGRVVAMAGARVRLRGRGTYRVGDRWPTVLELKEG